MRSPLSQLLAIGPELAAYILTSPLLSYHGSGGVWAQQPIPVPPSDLDLSQLGRVALGGQFDSISLYTYEGQSERPFTNNGSQSLMTQYPNGAFRSNAMSDANIAAMCPFLQSDGTLAGVVVGGNFTSMGGVEAQSVALFNPNTSQITPLPGLSGTVNALYCDGTASIVYVGGNFVGGNSSNAMAWTTGWVNLPFAGFNGPVYSITKNAAGNIVFGGSFSGLGNATAPDLPDGQVVNLGSGNITASGTTTTTGFTDPSQIICKTAGQDGPGNTWLLADNTAGWWEGSYGFGFNPTKMRLYNTAVNGRGTKMFYFENLNSGGILNLTYVDPTTGQNASCVNQCPMPQNNNTYQDFHFSPPVGMDMFRIYITDWYGPGGGLSGIEMFQDDIYSFAVDSFNEPRCDDVSTGSSSVATPNSTWTQIPNINQTSSDFLSAYLTDASQLNAGTNVVFEPDLKQSGNYSILLYTPGCIVDNSCSTRGQVNVTGTLTTNGPPFSTTIFQSNNYDKFDQIYYGNVDTASSGFRPTITLSPAVGQSVPLTVVAQRVRFDLVSSIGASGGLNGLFEYNPNEASVAESVDFSSSNIDQASASLQAGANVNAVAVYQNTLYVAGSFTGNGISNIFSLGSGNATALASGGLNADVMALYQSGSILYMGGNFTNSADGGATGLNNLATFDITGNKWGPIGAGVNGPVTSIVPLRLNVTSDTPQDCIGITGGFTTVNGFGSNAAWSSKGFAVWVPKMSNWLANIADASVDITGELVAYTNVPGFPTLYAGDITSQGLGFSGAVELLGSNQPTLQSFGIKLQDSTSSSTSGSSSKHKRTLAPASLGSNYTGVYDGLFFDSDNLNITVLGGSFSAKGSNGSMVENLMFINNTDTQQAVTGITSLDSDSIFLSMATQGTTLYAGGAVTGEANGNTVNGLIVFDLATNDYASPFPPALAGTKVVVNSITAQPSGTAMYVGGNFDTAGSLPCAALCYYDTSTLQWNSPGPGLSGTVNVMYWTSSTSLVIAGELTVSGNATTMATYDTKTQTFQQYTGASTLPGPITALSAADSSNDEFWVGGVATKNGSFYLSKYSNNVWTGASGLLPGTIIRGLQVMSLTANHENTALVASDQVLMISGNLNVPNFGNASAVLFNGTTWEPFILTNTNDGTVGSVSGIFVSNPQNFINSSSNKLPLGLVVLIGLAIALGIIFFLVVAGILIERQRRRREGYVPMTTDKNKNLERLPPETLLANLNEKGSPPKL